MFKLPDVYSANLSDLPSVTMVFKIQNTKSFLIFLQLHSDFISQFKKILHDSATRVETCGHTLTSSGLL